MLPFRKFSIYLSFSFFFLLSIATSSSIPFTEEETGNKNDNRNTIVKGRKVNTYLYSKENKRMKEEEYVKVTGIFKIESPLGKPISGMTLIPVDNAGFEDDIKGKVHACISIENIQPTNHIYHIWIYR